MRASSRPATPSGGNSSGTSTTARSSVWSRWSLSLRIAGSRLSEDPAAAAQLIAEASNELALGLEELRELARGIHPAVLTEHGLTPAVEALAARATLPVEVKGLPPERLSEPIEAAAYYVVSEALANVAKYASASRARVDLARDDGVLLVEVSDDGVGERSRQQGQACEASRTGWRRSAAASASRASEAAARPCGPSYRW